MKYIFLYIRTIFFNVSANSLKRTDEPYNGMNGGTLDDGEGGGSYWRQFVIWR